LGDIIFYDLSRNSFLAIKSPYIIILCMENLIAMPCMVVAITHDVSGAFMQEFDKIYRVESGMVSAG